jgi:CRP-like cAMP-binding protein
VLKLNANDYFGERALLKSEPRAANVITRKKTKVLFIYKNAFEEVLGPLSKIIDADRARREENANTKQNQFHHKIQKISDVNVLGFFFIFLIILTVYIGIMYYYSQF